MDMKVQRQMQKEAAAAADVARKVNEAKDMLAQNAEKLGDVQDTTAMMQATAQDFSENISKLQKGKPSGGKKRFGLF